MIKRGNALLLVLFVMIFAGSFVSAANNTNGTTTGSTVVLGAGLGSDRIEKAYSCLQSQINNNSKLSFQEAIFSTLALGSGDKLLTRIDADKGSNCWPSAGCKLKDTALAALAYNRAGRNTADIISWISSKNGSATELQWYLEIDASNHAAAKCKVNYDGVDRTVNINDDMTLQSNELGACLTVSSSGFWLRISGSCLGKEFQISCDQDFVTSLIYQKSGGDTVYVSSQTNGAASSGTTKEQVQAQCFKTGAGCDYEGSLWAAYALKQTGNDIASYLPYLIAFESENLQVFPSAFLYILTGGEDHYSSIIQSQKQNKFWEVTGGANGKFFDTALAILALQGSSAAELDNAKNYLASVQTAKGCWNNENIRDTAFILYATSPRSAGTGGGGATTPICTSVSSYSCGTRADCRDSGGSVLTSFDCPNAQEYCCNVKIEKKSCLDWGGRVCANGQSCTGQVQPSTDGSCCVGVCETQVITEDLCAKEVQGTCKSSCDSTLEDEMSQSCSVSGQVCCVEKSTPTPVTGSSSMWIWITILIILIVLVILGIMFRDKIRMKWFEMGGKSKSSPITRSMPPGFGGLRPGSPMRPMMRPMSPTMGRPVQRAPPAVGRPSAPQKPSSGDKDMDETFKKLKELSE